MKKFLFLIGGCLFFTLAFSQETSPVTSNSSGSFKVTNRAADHFMLQLSSDHLMGMPDSISSHQEGFSRGFNAYFMFDKQFKNSPKLSIGLGAGISTSNISFKKMDVDLNASGTLLPFIQADSMNHFKKYKLATSYLEIPLEFRYMAKPLTPNKSFKAAIGFKAGTLVNAHTKGKGLQDKNNNIINNYTEKISTKRYINSTRFMATARVGYGIFSVFGAYQLNGLLKENAGSPDMRLLQVGLTISGL